MTIKNKSSLAEQMEEEKPDNHVHVIPASNMVAVEGKLSLDRKHGILSFQF